ncbi:ATP-binding protein [Oceanisphaera sp. IT1-181]|uniref:ATP-binding protein n=1 Tax=Oceanisphaera sp. IT1-181 TaxID=3081199 RepID=UPI0029C9DA4A|nr:ATP-binding protein [Oceanisphaera sp. IT1-181]
MAKLLKVIMIHGHMPGVVELELDGHTNICGDNASGKTTLQRMIPVFYGEQPNKVVPRTRLSFDKYYLPHKNSYVIYEYQRPQHGAAQVVLTKRVDGIDYRFVDAPYQPEHYLLEKKDGVVAREYRDWTQAMRSLGIDITAKMSSTTEYRNIILNDIKNDRSSRSENLRLRQLAARYGLADDKHNLRHMEKLVSAVHAKEGKMSTLKSMLAAILEEDGYQHPTNTMTGDKIRSWLRDLKQFMKMDKLQQSLTDIERVSAERIENLALLWHLKDLVDTSFSQQRQHKADTEAGLQALKRAISEAGSSYEQARSRLREQKNDAATDLDKSQRQLADAQIQYDAYRDADMERIGRELIQLPERRNELQGLEQHYQLMTAAHQGVVQELQAHQLQLAQQLQQANAKIQESIKDHTAQQQRLHQDELEATKALSQAGLHQQTALHSQYEARLTPLQNERAAKQAQVEWSMLNVDELEQRNLADLRLEKTQAQLDDQAKLVSKQQHALTEALSLREKSAQHEQAARSAVAQGELHLEQLGQRLEPVSGSLQQFLSQHIEHWQHSFGRVLAEPLLQRTDLAPQLREAVLPANPALHSVFGVQLDLHAIELPDYALTEERVREQLEQASAQWQRQKVQLSDTEKALTKAVEQAKGQQQALDAAQLQERSLVRDVEFARDHKQRLTHEHKQLDQARKKTIQQRIQQLQLQLEQLKQQQHTALAELEAEQAARAIEQTADFQERQQMLQEAIDDLNKESSRLDVSYKERNKELEQAFSAKLAEQGVDDQRLRQLKLQIASLQQGIRDISNQGDAFSTYQQFMNVTWLGLRPTWLHTEQLAQQQLRTATAALVQHETEYNAKQQVNRTQLIELTAQLEKVEKRVQSLQAVVSRMAGLPNAGRLPSPETMAGLERGDVSEQIARAHQLLDEQQKLAKRLEDGVNALEADIRKDADLQFVRFMEDAFSQLGEAPG